MTRTERGAHVAEWAALVGASVPDGADGCDSGARVPTPDR